MDLGFTADERRFREEMRRFFTTEIPADIRTAAAKGEHVSKQQLVTSQRIMNQAGLAVPDWPVAWGGRDWTPVQYHIWLDEMQTASVPAPLSFNASMVGPVIAQFGSDAQKAAVPGAHRQSRHLVVPGFLRARRRLGSRQPAHHRAPRRRRLDHRRPEDLDHAGAARRLDFLPVPHRSEGRQAPARDFVPGDRHAHAGGDGASDPDHRRRPRGQRGLVR